MILSLNEVVILVGAFLLAGLTKGISGMGLPVVATPILTILFDLQTAIAVTIVSTFVTDAIMLVTLPKDWKLIKNSLFLMMFGIFGIIIGSFFLVKINQFILSGILGVIILVFVVTSFLSLLPTFKRIQWMDIVVGVIGGITQGATGVSGPIISMYLLQMKMNRNEFLFLMNSFFVMVDLVQIITIYQLGLYKGYLLYFSLIPIVPALLALAIGIYIQKRISDRLYRNAVLIMMSLSGLFLLYKSVKGLF